MDTNKIKKISFVANTSLLIFVLLMWAFFAYYKVDLLIYFSIPTTLVYIANYYLIAKGQLAAFVRLVYMWIPFYMAVTTICLGYNYGFHLYCMSMIPIIHYTKYISYKLGLPSLNSMIFCIYIAITYVISTAYAIFKGSIYEVGGMAPNVFLTINSVAVLSFIIFYTKFMVDNIISSEDKLLTMAHRDRLTGLFNRHYMIERTHSLLADAGDYWVAMVDIDDFKKINDTYGHDCGDYVLIQVSKLMSEIFKDRMVSRWGGEEFLIVSYEKDKAEGLLNNFRKTLSEKNFEYNNIRFSVTCTIGAASYEEGQSMDSWIKKADEKLYIGKTQGKNRVII